VLGGRGCGRTYGGEPDPEPDSSKPTGALSAPGVVPWSSNETGGRDGGGRGAGAGDLCGLGAGAAGAVCTRVGGAVSGDDSVGEAGASAAGGAGAAGVGTAATVCVV
jgi:hypothetical protein